MSAKCSFEGRYPMSKQLLDVYWL